MQTGRYVSKYFKYSEFDSPDDPGSGVLIDDKLLVKLDIIREIFGKPIRISSGVRSENWNKKVGGRPGSSHKKGLAADLLCSSSGERFRLLQAIMEAKIHRIGVGDTFIHIDVDENKPQSLIWTY